MHLEKVGHQRNEYQENKIANPPRRAKQEWRGGKSTENLYAKD